MSKEAVGKKGYICSVKKRELSNYVTVLGPHVCYLEYLRGIWKPRGERKG